MQQSHHNNNLFKKSPANSEEPKFLILFWQQTMHQQNALDPEVVKIIQKGAAG